MLSTKAEQLRCRATIQGLDDSGPFGRNLFSLRSSTLAEGRPQSHLDSTMRKPRGKAWKTTDRSQIAVTATDQKENACTSRMRDSNSSDPKPALEEVCSGPTLSLRPVSKQSQKKNCMRLAFFLGYQIKCLKIWHQHGFSIREVLPLRRKVLMLAGALTLELLAAARSCRFKSPFYRGRRPRFT